MILLEISETKQMDNSAQSRSGSFGLIRAMLSHIVARLATFRARFRRSERFGRECWPKCLLRGTGDLSGAGALPFVQGDPSRNKGNGRRQGKVLAG
jgi:hypothetical protein